MPRRRIVPSSRPFPEALPALLVHVWFFEGFGDVSELRYTKGFGANDLVTTLGRLRRVSKEFKALVDRTFKEWQTITGVVDGFWNDFPVATLYDLRASCCRSCLYCAKELDPRGQWRRFAGVAKRITEDSKVRDAPVLCCERCRDKHFRTREYEVHLAFDGASDYPVFFKNTTDPPTRFERFSGVANSMVLARNQQYQDHLLRRHQQSLRRSIELRLIRKAKKKDARIEMTRRLGVRGKSRAHERQSDYNYEVDAGVSMQGVVGERFLKRAAAACVAADGFVPHGPYEFGKTWQSTTTADAFMFASDSFSEVAMRERLRIMSLLAKRTVVVTLRGVRFLTPRRRGLVAFYPRTFDSLAVWLQVESVPSVRTDGDVGLVGLEVVVDGRWLHEHYAHKNLPELREAHVDALVLAGERKRLRADERGRFNAEAVRNARVHEHRIFAALTRKRAVLLLRGFASVLPWTIDRDFGLLNRLASPTDPTLRRQQKRGFRAHYGAGDRAWELLT